ncbi:MAG: hypothetical protein RBT75_14880 [Anaerolineae bacterium]|jgi:hypothetical protein|nr:hypothetical protein [Anaerolineae bacterium]
MSRKKREHTTFERVQKQDRNLNNKAHPPRNKGQKPQVRIPRSGK